MDEVARGRFDITHGADDMQRFFESRPYITSVSIYDGEDIFLQYRDMVTKEITLFNDQATKLKGKAFWTPVYALPNRLLDNGIPKHVISLIRAVISTENFKQIAYIRLSIDEETICSTFKDFCTSPDEKIFVINSEGLVISSTDKAMLMKDLSREPWLDSVMQGTEGYSEIQINGDRYKEIHYKIPETSWNVVQIIPNNRVSSELMFINPFIILSLVFVFIFLCLFLIIQRYSIIKPIKALAKEMEKVKKGIFDVNICNNKNKKDEIGVVNAAFVDMVNKINDLINKVYKSQLMEKEARLIALESQINPHFLYNALESLRWDVVSKGDYESAEQLMALADIFRHVLNEGKEMTTIRSEIEHLRNYIKIQKNRFGDKIDFTFDIDDEVLDCDTLKLILQPLVENSIKHGLEQKLDNGRIHICVKRKDDKIVYSVVDDGIGTDENKIREMLVNETKSHNVFALKNIQDRIQLKFGKNYGLEFHSLPTCGTRVNVTIPYIKHGKEEQDV